MGGAEGAGAETRAGAGSGVGAGAGAGAGAEAGAGERGERHWRGLEALYARAPCQGQHGHKIRIEREGEAECSGEVRPEFFHAAGALHGSSCWKMLDDAAFFAAQSLVKTDFVGTVSFSCNILRPVTKAGSQLIAYGRVVNRSKTLITCESSLYNLVGPGAQKKLVAHGQGTFMRMTFPLKDLEAYREVALSAKL